MLLKKFRLVLDKDIKRTLIIGSSFFTNFFNFKIIANNLPQTRFGIIISKKVHKSAVKRHRIKRQINEIIRLHLDKIKTGYDIIITVKNSIINQSTKEIDIDYQEIEKNILWALNKMKLIL